MRFEWDAGKNRENVRKHGIDFADAWEVFAAPTLIALDDRRDYEEDRWIAMGLLRSLVVVVVYSEPAADIVRIISVRKALSHERIRYEQALRDGLGAG